MDQERRRAIIKILGGSATLFALAAGAWVFSSLPHASDDGSETTSTNPPSALQSKLPSAAPTSIEIRVVYFGMPTAVTGAKKETLILGNPAYLSDLKTVISKLHPSLKAMIPTMLFLVDGVSAIGNPQLQSDVEVDVLAQFAGG